MSGQPSERLVADPHIPWEGDESPYQRLNRCSKAAGGSGLSPLSNMREIQDLLFDLMGSRLSGQERRTWDELRLPERRLVVDFFHYCVAAAPALPAALCALPMPLELPDFDRLLDPHPDLAQLLSRPERFETEPPRACPVVLGDPPILDFGPLAPSIDEVLGQTHE